MCAWGPRHTVISPFIALLISSQDATINIELLWCLLLCCSPQVRTLAHTPGLVDCIYRYGGWGGWGWVDRVGGSTGEAHAFIIKVSWDALQHLEVLKRALLREYVGIAHARKLATLPADVRNRRRGVEGGKRGE